MTNNGKDGLIKLLYEVIYEATVVNIMNHYISSFYHKKCKGLFDERQFMHEYEWLRCYIENRMDIKFEWDIKSTMSQIIDNKNIRYCECIQRCHELAWVCAQINPLVHGLFIRIYFGHRTNVPPIPWEFEMLWDKRLLFPRIINNQNPPFFSAKPIFPSF